MVIVIVVIYEVSLISINRISYKETESLVLRISEINKEYGQLESVLYSSAFSKDQFDDAVRRRKTIEAEVAHLEGCTDKPIRKQNLTSKYSGLIRFVLPIFGIHWDTRYQIIFH